MRIFKKFIRYGLVGIVGVMIHIGITYALALASKPVAGYVLGFCMANYWAYFMNSGYTFDSGRSKKFFIRYFLVVLVSMSVSTLIFNWLIIYSSLTALSVSLPIGILFQFCGHNWFTFKQHDTSKAHHPKSST